MMEHIKNTNIDHCGLCLNKIQTNHKFVNCALCKSKIHIKCNNIELSYYKKLDLYKVIPICIICNKENIPFYSDNNISDTYNKEFLASDTINKLFKGINDLNNELINNMNDSEDDYDLTPIIDCKYFDLISFKNFEEDKKIFSIIHLNIASLSLHKDELEAVLNILDFKFDVIGISETKIKKGIIPDYNVSIDGYQQYSTPTESDKGGVILYISKKYFCKPRKDLDKILYKCYALESIFVEIILTNKKIFYWVAYTDIHQWRSEISTKIT